MLHEFKESIQKSKNKTARALFDYSYAELFPGYVKTKVVTDRELQIEGVDVYVVYRLSFNRTALCPIQEKVRYDIYEDLFLEEFSCREHQTAGWTLYGSAEYVSFYWQAANNSDIAKSARVLIMPFAPLRRWFLFNRSKFEEKPVENKIGNSRYTTLNRICPFDDPDVKSFIDCVGAYKKRFAKDEILHIIQSWN